MIPEQTSDYGEQGLPAAASYWTPRPGDITEEGFANFRDTWLIRNVSVREARSVIDEERRIVTAICAVAADEAHYERLASAAESARDDELDDGSWDLDDIDRAVLSPFVSDLPPDLGGIELGVAGLVHALSAVRILPAASCRSHHPRSRSWSPVPTVFFASTRHRADVLAGLVSRTRCTFSIDPARPELLAVNGRSPVDLMDLATGVLDGRRDFVETRGPRGPRRRSPQPDQTVQEGLF